MRTGVAKDTEVTGTYTLILYGGRYSSDLENVAILDKEEDPYVFEVYAPDFDYQTKSNVPGPEALEEAENFVKFHRSFHQSQVSRIIGPSGDTIGYEVRPLYYPLDVGYADVLDIRYRVTDGKVIVSISLKDEVKRSLSGDDRPLLFRLRR
ncbi:MAG TPA: hypothetical protein VFG09_13790 [Thermodesulfovibrionales bacterium]|nr:hypothetical protein [Thermodesulfovibrionales bacterium]